ncbi:Leo1-like protein-domain-containing protein [Trametes elegans]|nr:Leo1-like protein-domain-containing protein [Trametes elegans]
MSSLAGALASPEPIQPILSPKPKDDAHDIMDDIKPPFASQDASPNEDEDKDEEELHDLFGEDEDVNMVEHDRPASAATSEHPDQDDGLSSLERRHREQMEYAEEQEPEPVVEHRLEADVAIPNIPVPRSSDGAYWVIRMPNFIKVDSKPFHPDSYVGPEHEDEDGHNVESIREKSMSIKLKVENTVRWRWTKDQSGQDRRQSNSRIVRWSDGSLSLQLGKELFDITQSVDNSGAMPRQALGGAHSTQPPLSQSQSQALPPPHSQSHSQSQSQSGTGLTPGQGLTYLVAQHKRAEILQCEALVTGYMSLRPTGMQSETHRMLVRAVGQKHTRVARLRMAPEPTTDPERERLELEKAAARKPRKSRGYGGGGGGGSSGFGDDDGFGFVGGSSSARRRRSGYARKRTGDDMWSDDDDDDGGGFGHGGSEDDYGDFGGDSSGRRHGSGSGSKRKKSADDAGRKGPGEYQTDDFLVADTDEDDDFGEEASSRRKRRRASRGAARDEDEDEDGAGEDDLERLEARISQNEAAERKRRQREGAAARDRHDDTNHAASPAAKDGGAGGAGEDAMDVESEEGDDDDDFAHRRARTASGPRKRRALGLDDEDDEE